MPQTPIQTNKNITVITVCYNSQETIARTIESVINQSQQDIEYVIIDGASTDNTLNIIKKYQQKYPIQLVSEPDNGIYDAMNKGVKIATGEWILFLNSDDYLYNHEVINAVAPILQGANCDILYGATEFRYDNFKQLRQARKLNTIWQKMPFNHQSCFTKTKLLEAYPFDTSYRFAADYDFFIYHYKNNKIFKETEIVISSFSALGSSDRFQGVAIKEYEKILQKHKLSNIKTFILYRLLYFKPIMKKVVPENLKKYIYNKFVR